MGDEEARVIAPAIEVLKRDGIDVRGPAPADTLFHTAARATYDVALCMYHDQALIPIKTVDFAGGVNVTLGLPYVRTSPDHGTALDIAGTGRADPASLIAALRMADTWPAGVTPERRARDGRTRPVPPLRETIAAHGLDARKRLGQHFLLDLNLTRRIARAAAPLAGGTVIEVGPGPGGLTRALLLEGATQVVALEVDARAVAALEELVQAADGAFAGRPGRRAAGRSGGAGPPAAPDRRQPAFTTVSTAPAGALAASGGRRHRHGADVPEGGGRPAGGPATQQGLRPALGAGPACLHRAAPVRRGTLAFVPPPKVTSSVVQLRPRPADRRLADLRPLERVTAAAFGQRRKMLRGALGGIFTDPTAVLTKLGLSPTARAEELTVADFVRLSEALPLSPG